MVTRDRYTKHIHEIDQNRSESSYLRTALAGGAIAALAHKRIPLPISKRILAGAGAGLAIQGLTRAGTARTKDAFGDRSYAAKRIDRAPSQIGAATTAGIIAHTLYKKNRDFGESAAGKSLKAGWQAIRPAIKKVTRLSAIELDDQSDKFERQLKRYARNPKARAEALFKNVNRGKRLLRDIREPDRLDARGRPSTPEWKKPWVKKAVGIALTGIAIRKGVKGIQGLRKTAAAQKAAAGEATGLAGILDAGEGFFKKPSPGVRSGAENFIRAHRSITRPLIKVHTEIKGMTRDTGDILNNRLDKFRRRYMGGTRVEQKAVAKTQEQKKIGEIKAKLQVIRNTPADRKRLPLSELQSTGRMILLEQPRSVIVREHERRDRRGKRPLEKINTERKIRDAITIGTGIGGVVGTQVWNRRAAARKAASEDPEFKQAQGGLRVSAGKAASSDKTDAVRSVRRRLAQQEEARLAKAIRDSLKHI